MRDIWRHENGRFRWNMKTADFVVLDEIARVGPDRRIDAKRLVHELIKIWKILQILLGRRLATKEQAKESLSVWTGVPVLGLDALASTGYGPEAGLTMLAPLGIAGLTYFPFIVIAIVLTLLVFFFISRTQRPGPQPRPVLFAH